MPLPARASAAAVHGEITWVFSQPSFHKTKKVLDCKRSNSYIWAKVFKRAHPTSRSVQTFPMRWLPCRLPNPRARSIVECLQPESLKAVFQSPSPSTRCPERRRHFITSDIFLTNLEKAYLIFFFLTMPCYLCLF